MSLQTLSLVLEHRARNGRPEIVLETTHAALQTMALQTSKQLATSWHVEINTVCEPLSIATSNNSVHFTFRTFALDDTLFTHSFISETDVSCNIVLCIGSTQHAESKFCFQ